ncbi:MAG: ABC transporter permease subunit [Kiritimatiellae bacterium]|nr:ABC transporter permease subunit [Kiritimatiellia bacterium]
MIRILTLAWLVWLEMLRRKDIYVMFILLAAFLATLMALNLFGLSQVVSYLKEIGLLLAWVCSWILAVSLSTRQLPQEERQGTIFPLLAKPVNRAEILIGKWLGAWVVVSAATLLFYALLAVVVVLRGGVFGGVVLAQAGLLHLVLLGIIIALGIAFSTRLNADAASALTYVVTLAAWLVLPRVPDLVFMARGAMQTGLMVIYYALPHLELFDLRSRLVYGWPPVSGIMVLWILVYGLLMTAVLLTLGWLAYRNKRFARGAML